MNATLPVGVLEEGLLWDQCAALSVAMHERGLGDIVEATARQILKGELVRQARAVERDYFREKDVYVCSQMAALNRRHHLERKGEPRHSALKTLRPGSLEEGCYGRTTRERAVLVWVWRPGRVWASPQVVQVAGRIFGSDVTNQTRPALLHPPPSRPARGTQCAGLTPPMNATQSLQKCR